MILSVADSLRTAQATLIADAINGGSGPGVFRYYSGTQPSPGGWPTILVAEQTLSKPCQSSISAGVIVFDAIGHGIALTMDEIKWMRCVDSDGNFVFDADVSDLSPLFSVYGVSSVVGLFSYFVVFDLPSLMVLLTQSDLSRLGSIVLTHTTFTPGEHLIMTSTALTVS